MIIPRVNKWNLTNLCTVSNGCSIRCEGRLKNELFTFCFSKFESLTSSPSREYKEVAQCGRSTQKFFNLISIISTVIT